ncbi:hypothetical protein PoB_000756600 [Plakobranchus ocellatus]|uniref:Uncharacterized protein n=1 Tax=Plakobranchus ocellatus TaxID=259542 RepID=A0AAV3YCY7_9GAST|nr:hypothetical protein PoB_000756600 [Plakobranchus ocellatus]
MFKSPAVDEILEGTSLSSAEKEEFLKNVEETYMTAGQQLLCKLPLILHNLSALDGDLRQHHYMKCVWNSLSALSAMSIQMNMSLKKY